MASRAPEILQEEWERLHGAYYAQFSEEEYFREISEEEMKQEEENYNKWFLCKGSEELIAYLEYSKRVGDEHQICDEDGEYILDEDGHQIQDWSESEDGFVINNKTGKVIHDKKGNPVTYPILDERVVKMYEDEEKDNQLQHPEG